MSHADAPIHITNIRIGKKEGTIYQ
jgi:hypothetical protein